MEGDITTEKLQLGIVGSGRMGGNLALQAVDKGIFVVGHSKHSHPELAARGVRMTDNYASLARMLKPPRVIFLSVPAGHVVDEVLEGLAPYLDKGDVVMDGGNSFSRIP